MGERVGDVTRAAGEMTPRRDSYPDGVIASPAELYSRIYPSIDVIGQDANAGRAKAVVGPGYGVADENSQPNAVPGLAGGRDVDPDDL